MPDLLLSVIRFVRLLLSGHQAVAIENAALRLQLAAFRRKRKRPVLTSFDRLFWVGFVSRLAHLARTAVVRSGRHGRPVAAGALPEVLGASVQDGSPARRQTCDRRR